MNDVDHANDDDEDDDQDERDDGDPSLRESLSVCPLEWGMGVGPPINKAWYRPRASLLQPFSFSSFSSSSSYAI